jgi:glycosyltransferase involved in cell wall biosynthesis
MQALFHERNMGRGGAVRDGFLAAQGDMVGYLDVDLEIPASVILPCLLALRQGHDVAVGKRIYKFRWRSFDRYVMSKGYAWLVRRVLGLHGLTDTESGCKFFRRDKVLPLLKWCQEIGWFWDTEIMALSYMAGLKIVEIPCLFLRRFDRASTLKPLRDSIDYFVRLLRFRAKITQVRASLVRLDEYDR